MAKNKLASVLLACEKPKSRQPKSINKYLKTYKSGGLARISITCLCNKPVRMMLSPTSKFAVFKASVLLGFVALMVPIYPVMSPVARAHGSWTHMARVVVAPVIHVSTERRFSLARAGQEKKRLRARHYHKRKTRQRKGTQPSLTHNKASNVFTETARDETVNLRMPEGRGKPRR